MLFLKKIGEKAGDQVCFDGIDQFYKCFFFLHTLSFVTGENSPAMHGWREIVFMNPHLYLFFSPETLQIICIY